MGRLFGTDGIRGVANEYPMTSEMALRIGRAIAHLFKRPAEKTRIVNGKDTRISGFMLVCPRPDSASAADSRTEAVTTTGRRDPVPWMNSKESMSRPWGSAYAKPSLAMVGEI